MEGLEEKIIATVGEFLGKIKNKFPETKPFITMEYPYYKKKLESLIPEAIRNSQSIEMASQVNIIYIYYIFISRLG